VWSNHGIIKSQNKVNVSKLYSWNVNNEYLVYRESKESKEINLIEFNRNIHFVIRNFPIIGEGDSFFEI
jgi:hypothetical protein